MIQRHQPHPIGTFAACSGCRREPRHVEVRGRSNAEPLDFRTGASATRHALECAPCGRSTARHPTLDAAIGEWGAAFAQGALPLRVVPRRRAVA